MTVQIETYIKDSDISYAARLALRHKLYVSQWLLSHELQAAKQSPENYRILILALKEDTPVGVCLCIRQSFLTQFFVRKAFRRQGIGKQLFAALHTHVKAPTVIYGSYASEPFFDWAILHEYLTDNPRSFMLAPPIRAKIESANVFMPLM